MKNFKLGLSDFEKELIELKNDVMRFINEFEFENGDYDNNRDLTLNFIRNSKIQFKRISNAFDKKLRDEFDINYKEEK